VAQTVIEVKQEPQNATPIVIKKQTSNGQAQSVTDNLLPALLHASVEDIGAGITAP
jgi:hypothetical protein